MSSTNFEQLESTLRTLGKRADLSYSKKQAIRDKVFRAIGQVELADAIVEGESKASALFVSLRGLRHALIPRRLSFSVPATIVTMLVVFLGSLVTGVAAQGAGPSDTLFWAKKVLEKVELAFTRDPVSKASATIVIAGERLKYLESSSGEQDLAKILKESQVALISAKVALNKAKAAKADTASVEELVERFGGLLNSQKDILADIEANGTDPELKRTVVAIRDALKDKAKPDQPGQSQATDSEELVVAVPTVLLPEGQPIVIGRVTVPGRLGTAGGRIVLLIGDTAYTIVSTPISLDQFVGYSVSVKGDFGKDTVAIIQLVVNNAAYGPFTQ